MTERQNKTGLQEDYFIDKKTDGFLDKISKSKWVRALFGAGVMASSSVTLTACDNTSPPAEVAPINEAVLSGVIDQNSAEKLTGSSKQIVDNSLAFIANESAGNENFVPGTERIYAVAKGADSFAWYFAGFKNEDGTVGLKVTHYCDSWVKDNENCQGIGKDLLIKLVEGNRVYHWTDNNDEQHPILLIDKDNNPVAFDIRGSSYVERVANSDGFLDKIVSIGATSVEAAAPEATVEPTATLPVVETATPEPTATVTEVPTATEEVSAIPEGFQVFTEITGLNGKVYDVTTVDGLKALNETNSDIVFNHSEYWLQNNSNALILGSYLRINTPGIQIGSGDVGYEVVSINGEVVGVLVDPVNIEKYLFVVNTGVTGLWPVKVSFNEGSGMGFVEINNNIITEKEKNWIETYYLDPFSFLEGISQLDDNKKIITFNEPMGEVDKMTGTMKAYWIIMQKGL